MSMQLRWLQQPTGHVLQWRHYHGSCFKDNRRGADEGWSEWVDVPTANPCPTCGSLRPNQDHVTRKG